MPRFLSALVLSLSLSFGLALELPTQADVILVASDGTVVGAGELEDGKLDLELLVDFVDFATLTFVDTEGNVSSYDVLVSEDGSVILTDSLESFAGAVAGADGEVEVSFTEEIEYEGHQAFGTAVPEHVELPQQAIDGIARAAANSAEAQERATEAQEEAAQRAESARDHAGHAEADESEDDESDSEEPSEEGAARAEQARNKAR